MLEHVPELDAASDAVPVAGGPYRFAAYAPVGFEIDPVIPVTHAGSASVIVVDGIDAPTVIVCIDEPELSKESTVHPADTATA